VLCLEAKALRKVEASVKVTEAAELFGQLRTRQKQRLCCEIAKRWALPSFFIV
jgi:hypothetical protein